MATDTFTPTLIIGIGGTGVAVLRRFKRLYLDLYNDAAQHIRLLAFDTDDQPETDEPKLDNSEFKHLAKPNHIDVVNVLNAAKTNPALHWLRNSPVPQFSIVNGAGMKRLYGHLAYFWRGDSIRKMIEGAVTSLLQGTREGAGQHTGAAFRIFIVSSLCGGTGTGMFLDISYLAQEIAKSSTGAGVQAFGLLFLPSSFQELKGKSDFWESIHANGYAALQELLYYMVPHDEVPQLPIPNSDSPLLKISGPPYQYSYLVGGVNEKSEFILGSKDLYERTAEFLFMNVTTNIGPTLVAAAVNREKCFASFGSCSLQLPEARNLQKYFVLMGKELLDDVLLSAPKQDPELGPDALFGTIPEYVELKALADGSNRAPMSGQFTHAALARFPKAVTNTTQAGLVMAQETNALKAAYVDFSAQLNSRANSLEQAMSEQAEKVLEGSWKIATGTIGTTLIAIERLLNEISGVLNKLQVYPAASETLDSVLTKHNKQSRFPIPFGGNPAAKVASFETDVQRVFEELIRKFFADHCMATLGHVKATLEQQKDALLQIRAAAGSIQADFRKEAISLLQQVAKENARASWSDTDVDSVSDEYSKDRLGLLSFCSARKELQALLGRSNNPTLNIPTFTRELFKAVQEFVTNRNFNTRFDDLDQLYGALQKAKINLNLKDSFVQPNVESMLFLSGDQSLVASVCDAIEKAPGEFGSPTSYPSVDPGSLTFVRMASAFKIDQVADIDFMADCYQRKKRSREAVYLDLPTHRRQEILNLGGEEEVPRLFAIGRSFGWIMDLSENFLLQGRKLLPADEKDPVKRHQLAYDALMNSDTKGRLTELLENTIQSLGGNEAFVPQLVQALDAKYRSEVVDNPDEFGRTLKHEKQLVLSYLESIGLKQRRASEGV